MITFSIIIFGFIWVSSLELLHYFRAKGSKQSFLMHKLINMTVDILNKQNCNSQERLHWCNIPLQLSIMYCDFSLRGPASICFYRTFIIHMPNIPTLNFFLSIFFFSLVIKNFTACFWVITTTMSGWVLPREGDLINSLQMQVFETTGQVKITGPPP